MNSIKLGDSVRDSITGLTGTAVCISNWLNGCVRVVVQPKEIKDGKPVDTTCFDVEQLEVVVASTKPPSKRAGGPCDDAAATRRA